ncbi:MAG: hypothetical protein QY326_00920 [Bdellovibrionota bacterium]|nr:MAG: hypothetical protein QY326_00920 [Bdellovibrionota bacterium]
MSSRLFCAVALVSVVLWSPVAFGEELLLINKLRDFVSTGPDNSLDRVPALFSISGGASRKILSTSSEETNIHSHYRKPGAARLRNYTYSGEMRILDSGGGIGVTFYSDYPRSDTYYRLRMYGGGSFHIEPHPDGEYTLSGSLDSGVTPVAGIWQKFKIIVRTSRARTTIRAKVWPRGSQPPPTWHVDVVDEGANRILKGKPGVWSMGSGAKEWRNLRVVTQ